MTLGGTCPAQKPFHAIFDNLDKFNGVCLAVGNRMNFTIKILCYIGPIVVFGDVVDHDVTSKPLHNCATADRCPSNEVVSILSWRWKDLSLRLRWLLNLYIAKLAFQFLLQVPVFAKSSDKQDCLELIRCLPSVQYTDFIPWASFPPVL